MEKPQMVSPDTLDIKELEMIKNKIMILLNGNSTSFLASSYCVNK